MRGSLSIFEDLIAQGGVSEETAWEVALHAPTEPETLPEDHRLEHGLRLWRDLIKRFLEHKKKKLRADYLPKYAAYLENPAFELIVDKPVASLKLRNLESVRDAIGRENGRSAVRRAVQQTKEALTSAWRNHGGVSGLEDVPHDWWQRLSFDYTPGRRTHLPTIEELARTLVIAERYRSLGDTKHAIAPGTLGALWMAMLTGQRTGQLVALPRSGLRPDAERPGWQVAIWNGALMKGGKSGGREHALPLPPSVIETLHAWWKEADGHVDNGALNRLLYRLCGVEHGSSRDAPKSEGRRRKRADRPAQREDLLAKHGIRRTLSTFLEDHRLGGAASAILAHRHKGVGDERELVAHVTSKHYSAKS